MPRKALRSKEHRCKECGVLLQDGVNIVHSNFIHWTWICDICRNAKRGYGKPENERDIFDTINLVIDDETTIGVMNGEKLRFIMGGIQIVCGIDPKLLPDDNFYDGEPLDKIRIFTDINKMAEWLGEYFLSGKYELTRRRVINVWCHNASFDFRLIFRKELGFKSKTIIDKPFLTVVWQTEKSGRKTALIRVLDTMSFFNMSLEKIMSQLNLGKKFKFDSAEELKRLKDTTKNWQDKPDVIARMRMLAEQHNNQSYEDFKARLCGDESSVGDVPATAHLVKIILEMHKEGGLKRVKLSAPALTWGLFALTCEPSVLLKLDPAQFKQRFKDFEISDFIKSGKLSEAMLNKYGIWRSKNFASAKKHEWSYPNGFPSELQGMATDACYGGRAEVFDTHSGRYYYLDKNALYAEVMRKYPLPIALSDKIGMNGEVGTISHPFKGLVKSLLHEGYLIVARCRVNVPVSEIIPPFPSHRGGKLRFDVGQYTTTICSPEFEEDRYFDMIEEFEEISVYEASHFTKPFISKLIDESERAIGSGDLITKTKCKLQYVSLSGKFGEHEHDNFQAWEDYLKKKEHKKFRGDRYDEDDYGQIDLMNGDTLCIRADGMYVRKFVSKANKDEFKRFSAPYAFITSYARKILRASAIERNASYVDTDSTATTKEVYEQEVVAHPERFGDKVGQWKVERKDDIRYIKPKVYVKSKGVKLKGVGGASEAYRDELLASQGESIKITGQKFATRRQSKDLELIPVNKEIKTLDDKRVHLSDGDTIPVQLVCFADANGNPIEGVYCYYCDNVLPDDDPDSYEHVARKCPYWYDLLEEQEKQQEINKKYREGTLLLLAS